MQIVVQDLLVHYEQQGAGKPVLLIHGWGDTLHTFDAISGDLAKDYQIISLDLPGFGQSQEPKQAWGLGEYAVLVHDFLEKLEIRPYAIIGHSNGGALAIHAIANDKVKTERLVLLASSGVRDGKKLKRFVIKVIAKTGKVLTFWLPARVRKRLQKKLYGSVGSDMLVSEHLQETFKKTVRQDVQADAAKLAVATLLIYGSEDSATPVAEIGERLHTLIKGSKLSVLAGADHFVHQTAQTETARNILEFLQ